MTTDVCVVIPVYNGARYVARALASVLRQTYLPSDVLVIDDGSTDTSAAIAEDTPGVRVIRQANAGPTVARNRGIAETDAPLIAFLDADDEWMPAKLERQLVALHALPDPGFSIAKMVGRTEPGATPRWTLAESDHLSSAVWGWLPSTLVVARSVFAVVGLFDATYRYSSDTDWFVRARQNGIPVAMCPEALVVRSRHDENLTGDVDAMQSELLTVLRTSIARERTNP